MKFDCLHGRYWDVQVEQHVQKVENRLNLTSDTTIHRNMTMMLLEKAAEVFLYMNTCPDTVKPWIKFYTDLFKNHPIDIILLTLNRLSKEFTPLEKDLKDVAMRVFKKATRSLSLKYPEIQSLSPGVISRTEGDITLKNSEGRVDIPLIILLTLWF